VQESSIDTPNALIGESRTQSSGVAESDPGHPIIRNTLFATVGQIVGVPLSILVNALTARYLGPAAFGYMYIGSTFNSFGFLAIEWGQGGALPALVATDRSRAGRLLGTSLVWRLITGPPIFLILLWLSYLLGYSREVRVVISLYFVGFLVSAITNACQWVILGFERVDVGAVRQFVEQFATLVIVAPILILGGDVNAALVGNAAATVIAFLYIWRVLPTINKTRLAVDKDALRMLLVHGTPFVFMSVVMVLQPMIDAAFLSKLASADSVGWYSAARRLIGFLLFPASALIGAIYPTLCRLSASDPDGFRETAANALRWTSVLVMPVALGCFLFPDLGIAMYSRTSFRQAEDDLRVLAILLFLMYFSMPLGTCIIASGRQKAWAYVQTLCVVVSLIVDPLLVPWFERRMANGGLGICVGTVISEVIVLIFGFFMAPAGVFGRRFWRSLVPVTTSAVSMVVVAYLLTAITSFVVAPLAVIAYTTCLWLTGGVDRDLVRVVRGMAERKVSRVSQMRFSGRM
jgi:O-antigen/teichoic acid export membrane protein